MDHSPSDREVCSLVSELAWRIDEHVRAATAGTDLTASQTVALRELGEPLTMRELALRMCCEPSNVTYVVDRLVARGLVERTSHPDDRRVRIVGLTTAGRRTRAAMLKRLGRHSPLHQLDQSQRAVLADLLGRALLDRP